MENQSTEKKKNNFIVTVAIIVTALVTAAGLAWYFYFLPSQNKNQFQAVFLTNGQVYFGHLRQINDQNAILSDVYYLRQNQPLQEQKDDPNSNKDQEPVITIVRLGGELHGPKNEMTINREHILFFETLRDDSKVVQAIHNYGKKK